MSFKIHSFHRGATGLAGPVLAAVGLFALAPVALSDFRLSLLAKFLCYALVGVGIALAWGRGGMLTLGQGIYFGLGAYLMAMHLLLSDAAATGATVPDFMLIEGTRELPWFWQPFTSGAFSIVMILTIPPLIALLLGLAVFRRRVKGAYFAILSQALALAFSVFITGQAAVGGANGLSNFTGFFGFDLSDPANDRMLYFLVAGAVFVSWILLRHLLRARYGELLIAVRDREERVRFLGYDPVRIKLVAYVISAFLAGVAGALFAPIVGIISPQDIGVTASLAFVIGVAIGGRASLAGAALGVVAVAWAGSLLSESFPAQWTYAQGIIFIAVVGFLPAGFASIAGIRRWRSSRPLKDRSFTIPSSPPTLADRSELGGDTFESGSTTSAELAVRDLQVTFDGFKAVDGVNLDVRPGEIRFLIGPNGAGKTTLIDAITGIAPSTGSVTLGGQEVSGAKSHQLSRLGVGRTFQTASVFEELTVLQNLDIAAGHGRSAAQLFKRRRTVEPIIESALATTNLSDQINQKAGTLSHGQKQWLEIAMLLVQDAKLLLLDEPVAGMSHDERTRTGELLRRICRDRTVLVVEHDMDFMREYATKVTVLHAGRVLAEGTVEAVQNDPQVREVYLGTTAHETASATLKGQSEKETNA
ncbi:urea ABC transporter permease subunit UrtC [Arthrobacter sp. AB6]|uniref:urea ABC transporter permease subunit UrtC n=1 Tax=Arthrobacter sp. AB6 TaxID=2962570 RepID=UPI002881B509|nr:urea ABC transporter permease subunit UrtC [Arthrobacter sp. AB6]MDT0196695.1 urea ABC transporter permease subunit UrtC [Arthrobacter sp. AB6]